MSDLETISYKLPYRDLKGTQAIMFIKVRGRLDLNTAPQLQKVLDDYLDQGIYRFILDLKYVTYIGSAGLCIFISLLSTLEEHHGQVVFMSPSPRVRTAFSLFEFTHYAMFTDNMKTAVEELRGKRGAVK